MDTIRKEGEVNKIQVKHIRIIRWGKSIKGGSPRQGKTQEKRPLRYRNKIGIYELGIQMKTQKGIETETTNSNI